MTKYIVVSNVKKRINEKMRGTEKMRSSKDLIEALDKKVEAILDQASIKTIADKRTTILGRDID